MSNYCVYALYTIGQNGSKNYFYVGRTGRDVQLRIAEHRNLARRQPQDVYVYMRQLAARQERWYGEVLHRVPASQYEGDAEHYHVIVMLRAGHDLRNMRYGDRRTIAFLNDAAKNLAIRSIEDVARERRRQAESGELVRVRSHRRLRRKELEVMLKSRGVSQIEDCALLPPMVKRRLLRQGAGTIGRGLTLAEVVAVARGDAAWRRLRLFAAEINRRNPLPKPVKSVSGSR